MTYKKFLIRFKFFISLFWWYNQGMVILKVKFRKIKEKEELNQLSELIQVIWPEVFVPIIGQAQVSYMLKHYQSVEKIQTEIAEGVAYYFIELANQPIGYFAYENQEKHLFISKIYLLDKVRGQGFSRKVIEKLEQIAQKHGKKALFLYVNRNNTRAIAIYQHYGFEIIKEVDTAFGKFWLNDYYMAKKLPF
jgi:ribosomal protein S18 acetylase RimI-like enzyme